MASTFSLSLPTDEEVLTQVKEELAPKPEETAAISDSVKEKTREVMAVQMDSLEERKSMVAAFENFGADLLVESRGKNNILEKRMINFTEQGGESGQVAKGLTDLTLKMKDLDPSGIDFLKGGALGKLFNPARRYFERFKTADQQIASIVESLEKGKKTLKDDNTTLEIEQNNMRTATKKLMQMIEMGNQLDLNISNEVENAKLSGEDEEKIKFVEEELLYPLRQRVLDFQQLLTVNQQGIIAMELIRRNNLELIRSVDRAKVVTINALRTAVLTASALYDQKIVLDKVNALNDTTNKMIEATAHMLKEQGTEIQKQASDTAVSVDSLKVAFEETMQALEDISNYKQEALPRMKETIHQFAQMASEGESRIQKIEQSKVN